MTDLFLKTSKKEQLLQFILSRNWTKSNEVVRWGIDHFHIRAMRDAQDLAVEGHIRRMTEYEERSIGHFGKEGVWVAPNFKR
jgi:hypothetical protein